LDRSLERSYSNQKGKVKMAKVRLDPLFSGISGRMGDLVFRTSKNGQVTVSQRPRKSGAAPSEAQQANRQRFAEASKYASAALANPALRAVYENRAAKEGTSAFALARNDYLQGKDLLTEK
jgi:hypothetical protein